MPAVVSQSYINKMNSSVTSLVCRIDTKMRKWHVKLTLLVSLTVELFKS